MFLSIKNIKKNWKELKQDKKAFQSVVLSSLIHGAAFAALIYFSHEKIIAGITGAVEFQVISETTQTNSPIQGALEQTSGKAEKAPEVMAKPSEIKKAVEAKPVAKVTPKKPSGQKIAHNKKTRKTKKKTSRKVKASATARNQKSSLPSDPELRQIRLAQEKLVAQEKEFQRQLKQRQEDRIRRKKIEAHNRKLQIQQEAFRLKVSNARKQEQIQEQLEASEKQLLMQQEKLKLQQIAQNEFQSSKEALLNKQKELLAQEAALKAQQQELINKEKENNLLADRQARLALRQEALKTKLVQDREWAEQQKILDEKRRQVEAAEGRARLNAAAQARASSARKALQNQEAQLKIREQKARSTESRYGISLPEGSRSVTDLKQRPGNKSPYYPFEARKQNWQGEGLILYYVTKDGYVRNVQVVKSTGFKVLDDVAIQTFRTYRFFPGQSGWTYHPIRFSLKRNSEEAMASR